MHTFSRLTYVCNSDTYNNNNKFKVSFKDQRHNWGTSSDIDAVSAGILSIMSQHVDLLSSVLLLSSIELSNFCRMKVLSILIRYQQTEIVCRCLPRKDVEPIILVSSHPGFGK